LTFTISSTPTEDYDIFSMECFLILSNIDTPPIFFKAVMTMVYLALIFLILIVIKLLKNTKNQKRTFQSLWNHLKSILRIAMYIYFMNNIVLLMSPLIKFFFCINVGDAANPEYRLLRSMDITCMRPDHSNYVFIMAIPLVAIFGLFIPIFITLRIYRAKKLGRLRGKKFIPSARS
jgi:hypothetical protein